MKLFSFTQIFPKPIALYTQHSLYIILILFNNLYHMFQHNNTDYRLDKPLVIAEFNQKQGGSMTSQQQYTWAYEKGYAGAWGWSYTDESWSSLAAGMNSIKSRNDRTTGGKVRFNV